MKIAFLDRDGTIIKDYPDEAWRQAIADAPEFYEGSITFLQQLQKWGYQIIFISNQYLINDGIITHAQFHKFNNKFLDNIRKHNIQVLDFFYCPHTDEDNCNCKKPKTGMIEQTLQKYPQINLANSFYVGDSHVDVELAEKFNLKMFHITTERFACSSNQYTQVSAAIEVLEYL